MQRQKPTLVLAAVALLGMIAGSIAPAAETGGILDLLETELNREMEVLSANPVPPYYMSYMVTDVHRTAVSAEFGSLVQSDSQRRRLMTVDVRVGDYDLDNTHELRDRYEPDRTSYIMLPLDDGKDALATAVWRETNDVYRQAVDRYTKVQTNVAIKVAEEDSSADFSRETTPEPYFEPPVDPDELLGERRRREETVKRLSAVFLGNPEVYGGRVSFSFNTERKHLVTSEGAKIAQNLTYARMYVSGFVKADDGMEIPLYRSWSAFEPGNLPSEETVAAEIREMIDILETLRTAPVIEPYTGPAILSGRAAGVFFHEIFGHRVEGHRQKSESEGQTFKKQVGNSILPGHLSVIFDPTRRNYDGEDLTGWYAYDDEGVRGKRVAVVENGVLERFLMSRSPIEGFPRSNGHGRAQAGYSPVARQSNMIVASSDPVPDSALREQLIERCREQGKPFGLYIDDIQGGYTFTGRSTPNVFNLLATEVYKVYTDGRPDEPVRGADLVGTPLVMFSMIESAGEQTEIFHGICGAESGSVPVSAVAPSLLVSQVEVQKKSKSQDRKPILPRPDTDDVSR